MGLRAGDSLITALADNERLRAALENRDAVIAAAIARLRVGSGHLGGDPVLAAGIERLARAHAPPARADDGLPPAFIPTRYRFGGRTLAMVSTLAQFGGVEDLTLAELRVELMFPADAASRELLVAFSPPPSAGA